MFFRLRIKNCLKTSTKRAFTLMELIIVMSLGTILITTLVVSHNRWHDTLVVNTEAYELALIIRQAQVYSLGVKEHISGTGDKFNIGYGVHFDEDTPLQYIFFADRDRDLRYDSGEMVGDINNLTRGVSIDRICGTGGSRPCSDTGSLDQISLSFFRPEPKSNIRFMNNGGNDIGSLNPPATIYLQSPEGREAAIRIEANGQISIQ